MNITIIALVVSVISLIIAVLLPFIRWMHEIERLEMSIDYSDRHNTERWMTPLATLTLHNKCSKMIYITRCYITKYNLLPRPEVPLVPPQAIPLPENMALRIAIYGWDIQSYYEYCGYYPNLCCVETVNSKSIYSLLMPLKTMIQLAHNSKRFRKPKYSEMPSVIPFAPLRHRNKNIKPINNNHL